MAVGKKIFLLLVYQRLQEQTDSLTHYLQTAHSGHGAENVRGIQTLFAATLDQTFVM